MILLLLFSSFVPKGGKLYVRIRISDEMFGNSFNKNQPATTGLQAGLSAGPLQPLTSTTSSASFTASFCHCQLDTYLEGWHFLHRRRRPVTAPAVRGEDRLHRDFSCSRN